MESKIPSLRFRKDYNIVKKMDNLILLYENEVLSGINLRYNSQLVKSIDTVSSIDVVIDKKNSQVTEFPT